MNMNFIAFSSRVKLLAPGSWLLSRLAVARWATTKWPAFRRRHRRPGFPRRRRPPPSWTSRSCRSRQYIPGRWTSRPSRCGRMAADTSLSFRGGRNRQPRWLRAEVGEACALERSDAPIRIGAQLCREGLQGLERALDRGAVGGGLRSQEADPRQRDIEGAKPPTSSPIDELTRLGEERAGSRAVTGGQLRVRERREDARLVPQRGAPITSERERPLEHTRGRGEVAVRELRSAEKRRGLHPREHASALFRELDGTAAVGERAGQIPPQAQHLAQNCACSVEGLECALALLGEECLQGGLSLGRAPEVGARQRPPDAAQARCGGTPDPLPQSGNLRDLGQSTLGGRTGGSEAADRKLCVGQH